MKELLEGIQKVSMSIKNIEKNSEVKGTGGGVQYKATKESDVLSEVRKAEEAAGIISIPISQTVEKSEIVRSMKKEGYETLSYSFLIKMTVRIYLISDPKQYLDVESYGHGVDSGDKATGKASTYARKYALLNAYKIVTGEDPDKEASKEETSMATDAEKNAVYAFCLKDNKYLTNVLSKFGVGSLDDLSKSQISTTHATLKAKGLI